MGAFVKGKKTREKTTGANPARFDMLSCERRKTVDHGGAYHQAAAGLPDREKTTG